MKSLALASGLALLSFVGACGDGDAGPSPSDAAADATLDTAADASAATEDAAATDATDAADGTDWSDVFGEAPPATWAEQGLVEARMIMHLHSAFSHDGCDNGDGVMNWTCVHRMKRALCAEHIAVAFMTDHPSYMRDQPFGDLLYAEPDAGDVVDRDADGHPIAVHYACPSGEGGPDGKATLFAGYEGTHTMGVGLARHLDPMSMYGVSFTDDTTPADLDGAVATVDAAGGFIAIAHSEEDDVSAATLAAHGEAAMELYNFHANFKAVLANGLGDKIFELDSFLDPTAEVPDPDLAGLVMFDTYPEPALTKWRAVSLAREITAFAGSDIHENASLPALCATEGVCDGLATDYPNLVAALTHEGPVMMSDGDRLDAYARIMGWVQNRVLVAADASDVPKAVRESFLAGRNVVVFEVLGDAVGEVLVARAADGRRAEMGDTVSVGDDMALWARAPEAPLPGLRASWTDGAAAEVEAIVWRTDASGTTEVARTTEPGGWMRVRLDAAGSYHMEVWITPRHLVDALGPAASLADERYRWVETNAIRVAP